MVEISEQTSKLKRDALKVIWQAIESVNPENAINRNFRLKYENLHVGDTILKLSDFQKVHIVGAGKASTQMAKALENILLKRLTGGMVYTKRGSEVPLHTVNVFAADHPVPDRDSLLAAQRTMEFAKNCELQDLIICLISGGASAMWSLPVSGVNFEDKQKTVATLLKCGANIHEMNTIRKHLSRIKGGHLAQMAHPATVVTLAISDVVGDEISSIGSGPTVGDPTTFKQAMAVLEKYNIALELPSSVLDYLWNGAQRKNKETPKPSDPLFKKNPVCIISTNGDALNTAMETGRHLGYKTYIHTGKLTGEASVIGPKLVQKIKEMAASRRPGDQPIMMLSGGETTVTVKGNGKGGRNQELALAAAIALEGEHEIIAASIGTDGVDGETDAAGAFADSTTITRGKAKGLDAAAYLADNNSYEYFSNLGDLIKTGPTGTNVMDIQVLVIS